MASAQLAASRAEEPRIAGLEIAYTRRMAQEALEEKERQAAAGAKRQSAQEASGVNQPLLKKTSMFDVFR